MTENSPTDRKLIQRILSVKRESRMARNNSEDAATWSVFRYLEKNDLLNMALGEVVGENLINPHVFYWSYSQLQQGVWVPLVQASEEFGETKNRSTEPDIIIDAVNMLVFVECKFIGSFNKTKPANEDNPKSIWTAGRNGLIKFFRKGRILKP